MNQVNYGYWVEYLKNNYLPLPDCLVADFSNWRSRSLVARALIRAGEPEAALELLKTVIFINLDLTRQPLLFSEVEDKVWCLMEAAKVVWELERDGAAALDWLEQAAGLTATYPFRFCFVSCGEVWYTRLLLLCHMGQADKALEEVQTRISNNRFDGSKANSVMHYALQFQAYWAKEQGNWFDALQFLRLAFRYYPASKEEKKQFNRTWSQFRHNPAKAYAELTAFFSAMAEWGDAGIYVIGDCYEEGKDATGSNYTS